MFRFKELFLLFLVFLSLAFAFQILAETGFQLAAVTVSAFIIASFALAYFAPSSSQYILPLSALITGFGLVNMLQISPDFFYHQLFMLAISTFFFILTLAILRFLKDISKYKYISGLTALTLFFLPAIFGITRGGAKLWLDVGPVVFQPSEIAKIFFFVFIAGYFAEHRALISKAIEIQNALFELRYLGPALIFATVALLLLVLVRDLGFSLLLLLIFLIGIYTATARKRYPLGGLLFFILGTIGAYHIFPHVHSRISIWLDPWSDVYGKSYQIIQGLFAFAEGGFMGRGLGEGFPKLLPAVHTDMVFPIWTETTGFIGAIILLALYFSLMIICLAEAQKTPSDFARIFVSVASLAIFIQTAIVVSGTLRLLPLTGLTMPFFSYGGSSLVSSFITLAMILSFGSERKKWIVQ